MPGGASGVAWKSMFPNRYAWADNFELDLDAQRRFRVRLVCGRSKSQRPNGKSGSTEARIDLKLFLNVWNARSAAFTRCTCGGTNW